MPPFEPRSDLVRVLQDRGHIYQATDLEGLDQAALAGPISAYIGFDATASRLPTCRLEAVASKPM